MKKVITVIYLFLCPIIFVYSQTVIDTIQTEVESDCEANLENIFKIFTYRYKYEIVQYIYRERSKKKSMLFIKSGNSGMLNHYFTTIKGFSLYPEESKDSIPRTIKEVEDLKPVEWMSEEEINSFFENLNYTIDDAREEYSDFIRMIILEKELYMECVNAELAKGDKSEYAEARLHYDFKHPMVSIMTPWITRLDFLKVFKEFILEGGELFLPEYSRVKAYLECDREPPPCR